RLRRVPLRALVPVRSEADARSLGPGQIGVWANSTQLGTRVIPGAPDRSTGAAQLAWIDEAVRLVQGGIADALVTGPVSQLAIATSGARGAARFRGHTEHLAKILGAREVVMAFRSEALTTALVTTHLPIARVPRAVTPEAVARSAYWLTRLLSDLDVRSPRV